jgi:hypothetical protein
MGHCGISCGRNLVLRNRRILALVQRRLCGFLCPAENSSDPLFPPSAFRSLLQKAIERGQEAEEAEKEGKIGANYTQTVRATICRGMEQNKLDLDAV